MLPDRPSEGKAVMVHGGDRNSKSTSITIEGIAWKLISVAPFSYKNLVGIGTTTYQHVKGSQPTPESPDARQPRQN